MKIIRSIILCMSLLFSLTAQQPIQQSQPTLMQKIKKEWKKITAFGATAAATIGTAIYLGVNQYRYSKMTPYEKSQLLPDSTIPILKPLPIKTPQEVHDNVQKVIAKLHSPEVQQQIQETNQMDNRKMSTQGIIINNDDVNINQYPQYPLHLIGLAAEIGNPELTQLLIDAGSKVNHGNAGDGQSALDIATRHYIRSWSPRKSDYLKTIEILLKNYGCHMNVREGWGWANNPVLYDLFTQYGYRGSSRLVRVKVGETYQVQSLECDNY